MECVKIGGLIVYATCSISDMENDGVIEKALANKRGFTCDVLTHERSYIIGEKTKFGWIVLPDDKTESGWGPLYFCVLKRVPTEKSKTEYDDSSDDEEDK